MRCSLAAVTEYLAAVPEERYLELAAAVAAQRHLFAYSAEKSQALSAVDVTLGTTCQCAPFAASSLQLPCPLGNMSCLYGF